VHGWLTFERSSACWKKKRKAGFGENEEDNAVLTPFASAQSVVAPARGYMRFFIIRGRAAAATGSASQSEDICARDAERSLANPIILISGDEG